MPEVTARLVISVAMVLLAHGCTGRTRNPISQDAAGVDSTTLDLLIDQPAPAPDIATPTCNDGAKNGKETDMDCGGGTCAKCAAGKRCNVTSDCISAACKSGVCQAASCADGVINGKETDKDCGGGACPACTYGSKCASAKDCKSGICSQGVCQAASCNDGVKNGSETDKDCGGGTCPKCGSSKACSAGGDCKSGVCIAGACLTASCNDNVKNGGETDVDCGGGACAKCANTKVCYNALDCLSGVCQWGLCLASTCLDGVKNGGETDMDCGGTSCAACVATKKCKIAADCKSGICTASICQTATCTDKVKNGGETDADCGGPTCAACPATKGCNKAADCKSGVCTASICQAPSCSDGLQNGDETDKDCGGSSCTPCAAGKMCSSHKDCYPNGCDSSLCTLIHSCAEVLVAHPKAATGIYSVLPVGTSLPFPVYCHMSMGAGGWTLIESLTRDHALQSSGTAQWYKNLPRNESTPGMTGDYRLSYSRMDALRQISYKLAATTGSNGLTKDYWTSMDALNKMYSLGDDTGTVNYKNILYEELDLKGTTYKNKSFRTWMRSTPNGWPSGGHNCVDDSTLGCSSCDYWGYNKTRDPSFTGHISSSSKTHYWVR